MFEHIGEGGKEYVEFGFDSNNWVGGGGANTRLLNEKGWHGLLLDGGHENPSINLHKAFVSPDNIISLFDQYKVSKEVDYISIGSKDISLPPSQVSVFLTSFSLFQMSTQSTCGSWRR